MKYPPFDKLRIPTAALAALVLFAALPATADEHEQDPPRTVIKAMSYIDVSEAGEVLSLLEVQYAFKPDQDLIVLRGPQHLVENALKVLEALDQPRPSIDLQVFVLAASKEGDVNVPESLEVATSHLRGIFGYQGFELLDHVMLQVLEGRSGRADGGIILGQDSGRTGYQFSFEKITLMPCTGDCPRGDKDRKIRLKDLQFAVNGQVAGTLRARLKTDIEIREGQKAVIGSSTPQGIGETLILIVEANAPPDPSWEDE